LILFRKALAATAATLLSLVGATLPVAVSPAVAADAPAPPKKLFAIHDDRVIESSGLAKSHKYDGLWWTVNDSDDGARIFGLNEDGEVEAVLTFRADVHDVEAIAVGPDGRIYVADIGDNTAKRDMITVYAIAEPDKLEDQAVRFRGYDFEYPDGAHDAETLLVHPKTGRMYIVTKVMKGKGAFYAAPEDPEPGTKVNKLTRMAAAPSGVTDGTFLPDAGRVVLRTYFQIAALTWGPKPNVYARVDLPPAQGESVALGPTATSLAAGSEGADSVVYQVPVPPRKPAASTSVKPAAGAGGDKSHNLRRILIGAGAFALLAAIVTFPTGRRKRDDAPFEAARAPMHGQRRRSTV
jgi:hypothetical protein